MRNSENNPNLNNIFEVFKIDKVKIFILSLIATLIVAVYAFTSTPIYESKITLYPQFGKSNMTNNLGSLQNIASTVGLNLPNSNNELFDVKDIVNSHKLLKLILLNNWVIDDVKMNLISYWKIDSPSFLSIFFSSKNIDNNILKQNQIHQGIELLESRISYKKDETGLNTIIFKIENPELASDIVNFITDFLREFISNEINLQASVNRIFLEERLKSAKIDLSNSENELKEYQEKYSLINDNPENLLIHGRLIRNIEVNQQVYITLKQQYELAKIEELREKPIINVLDYGIPNYRPVHPKKIKLIAISLIFSFVGSLYFFYIKDRFINLYK